jgi:hypothetical protein
MRDSGWSIDCILYDARKCQTHCQVHKCLIGYLLLERRVNIVAGSWFPISAIKRWQLCTAAFCSFLHCTVDGEPLTSPLSTEIPYPQTRDLALTNRFRRPDYNTNPRLIRRSSFTPHWFRRLALALVVAIVYGPPFRICYPFNL